MKNTKNKTEFKALLKYATLEAKNINKSATQQERNKLNSEILRGSNYHRCVYGLMTGDCRNGRAIDIIAKSAPVFYVYEWSYESDGIYKLHNRKVKKSGRGSFDIEYFTAIEVLIFNELSKIEKQSIIDVINGISETIKIDW